MRLLLTLILGATLAWPQIIILPKKKAAAGADVERESILGDVYSPSTSVTVVTPSMTAGTNRALFVMIGTATEGAVDPTGISGAGATWTAVGSATAGNGFMRGRCYVGIAPTATGAANLTVTYSSGPSYGVVGTVVHLKNASQSAVNYTCTITTSGNQVLTVPAGGIGTSIQMDTTDIRTVTGCTTDEHFAIDGGGVGISAASCTAASSTFTWSGYGTNSIAIGMAGPKQ